MKKIKTIIILSTLSLFLSGCSIDDFEKIDRLKYIEKYCHPIVFVVGEDKRVLMTNEYLEVEIILINNETGKTCKYKY